MPPKKKAEQGKPSRKLVPLAPKPPPSGPSEEETKKEKEKEAGTSKEKQATKRETPASVKASGDADSGWKALSQLNLQASAEPKPTQKTAALTEDSSGCQLQWRCKFQYGKVKITDQKYQNAMWNRKPSLDGHPDGQCTNILHYGEQDCTTHRDGSDPYTGCPGARWLENDELRPSNALHYCRPHHLMVQKLATVEYLKGSEGGRRILDVDKAFGQSPTPYYLPLTDEKYTLDHARQLMLVGSTPEPPEAEPNTAEPQLTTAEYMRYAYMQRQLIGLPNRHQGEPSAAVAKRQRSEDSGSSTSKPAHKLQATEQADEGVAGHSETSPRPPTSNPLARTYEGAKGHGRDSAGEEKQARAKSPPPKGQRETRSMAKSRQQLEGEDDGQPDEKSEQAGGKDRHGKQRALSKEQQGKDTDDGPHGKKDEDKDGKDTDRKKGVQGKKQKYRF